MTYCCAIRLDAGLVLASDSRTSAGVDDISIYSKMHRFDTTPDRLVVLLSAGNLATTQTVIRQVERDVGNPEAEHALNRTEHLDEIARYIGGISAEAQTSYGSSAEQSSPVMEASFILAGQIGNQPHEAFLIYPLGNYIAASPTKPFLQIGETKYGKPILDRMIDPTVSLERAARCALISMDAAMRSNLSVGPPIELLISPADRHEDARRLRYDEGEPYLTKLREAWADGLNELFVKLPRFDWEA